MRNYGKKIWIATILCLMVLVLASCGSVELTISKPQGEVGAFALKSPANAAGEVSITPVFAWEDTPNAYNYKLVIATDEAFEEVVFTRASLAKNEFKMSSKLYNDTQYFWRVIATGENEDNVVVSTIASFNTKVEEAQAEEQIIDDFESYEYIALLQSEYYAPNGDNAQLCLLENAPNSDFVFSEFFDNGRVLEVEYDLHTHKFSNFTRNLHRSLLGTDGISFKIGNLGTSIKVVLDIFEKGGEGFRVYIPIRGVAPYTIHVPYSAFDRHMDAGIPQDGILQVEDISKITIAIATDAEVATGKAYIDDMKAYVNKSYTEIENTGFIAIPLEANAPIIDLENLTNEELSTNMDYHTDGGVSTFGIIGNEEKQLKWDYGFDSPANKYWSMIRYYGYWNFSENDGISMRIKGDGSNQRLIIQLKDADGEFFNLKLKVDFDGEIEIKIPFNTLILKGVDDWGVEVDGLLYKEIINEISFAMESNVYTSEAKGGTLYLADICGFSDKTVKGLTIDGVDVQSVDLSHNFEVEESFDIENMIFSGATGEIVDGNEMFGENALKIKTTSTEAKASFELSPQLKNASGIAFWARTSSPVYLGFVLSANDGNNYIQNTMLNKGLNFVVLKMNGFKNGSNTLNLESLDIKNYYLTFNTDVDELELFFDEFYAFNVYNSALVGEKLTEMIAREMVSLPSLEDINIENYQTIKEKTDTITGLIMRNIDNTEILFSLISLAPHVGKFFAVLNKIDDIEIEQTFEFGSVFKTNMVAQQGQEFVVYGFGKAEESIKVTLSGVPSLDIGGTTLDTVIDGNGRFEVVFPKEIMQASTKARTLKATIGDDRIITVSAILVGNVYMIMGQDSLLNNVPDGVTFGKNINARIYNSYSPLSGSEQQTTLTSSWNRTNTASYEYANSMLSYIANMLYQQDTDTPIGIIALAYGTYTPIEAFASFDGTREMIIDTKEGYHSGSIYNTYIHPLLGIGLSGVIVMHGGGFVTNTELYKANMVHIQQDMTNKFATNDLQLYIVQSMSLSRFTDFSYTAAQSLLMGLDNINVIPATDINKIDAEGLQTIANRLMASLMGNVVNPYVTSIERTEEGFDITFSREVTATGAITGFRLGNEAGEYNPNITVVIDNKVIRVKRSIPEVEFINVFYNVSGKGNLTSSLDNALIVGSFCTFNSYTIQSYNFIDEMKYESIDEFDNNWLYRVAGATQANTKSAVSLINDENKIKFNYLNQGMQIITTPINTSKVARDITDIKIWVKTDKKINFQCYLWFGSYPTDAKRYQTALSIDYSEGGYIYIPITNVWGSIENCLDSLTHIGIGVDMWAVGSIEIGEITFAKAEEPERFSLVKPATNGVVAPSVPIEFLWEVSKRAENYRLEIFDNNGNGIKNVETNKFYYLLTEGLAEGNYTYRVTAINDKGGYSSPEVGFRASELVRTDRLYQDFEMTTEEFKEDFTYRNSSNAWTTITDSVYASIETVAKENGNESNALKIDSLLAQEGFENYYLAVRGSLNSTDAYGARYLKFWYSSNKNIGDINENARIEINLYIGTSHYYVQLFNVKKGEGYIYVALSDFTIGSGGEKYDVTKIEDYSIGINNSKGAIVYFDDISLTYKKE